MKVVVTFFLTGRILIGGLVSSAVFLAVSRGRGEFLNGSCYNEFLEAAVYSGLSDARARQQLQQLSCSIAFIRVCPECIQYDILLSGIVSPFAPHLRRIPFSMGKIYLKMKIIFKLGVYYIPDEKLCQISTNMGPGPVW